MARVRRDVQSMAHAGAYSWGLGMAGQSSSSLGPQPQVCSRGLPLDYEGKMRQGPESLALTLHLFVLPEIKVEYVPKQGKG